MASRFAPSVARAEFADTPKAAVPRPPLPFIRRPAIFMALAFGKSRRAATGQPVRVIKL